MRAAGCSGAGAGAEAEAGAGPGAGTWAERKRDVGAAFWMRCFSALAWAWVSLPALTAALS